MSHWTAEMRRAQSERAKRYWLERRDKQARGELLPSSRDPYKQMFKEQLEENVRIKRELEAKVLQERRAWHEYQHPKVTFEDILIAAEIFMQQNPSWEIVFTVRCSRPVDANFDAK